MITQIVRGVRGDDFMPVLQVVLMDGQVAVIEADLHEAMFQTIVRHLRDIENGLRTVLPEDTIEEVTTL